MKIVLRWEIAIEKCLDGTTEDAKATSFASKPYRKAHNAILLCLGNPFVRDVAKETPTGAVWLKLESLFRNEVLLE